MHGPLGQIYLWPVDADGDDELMEQWKEMVGQFGEERWEELRADLKEMAREWAAEHREDK